MSLNNQLGKLYFKGTTTQHLRHKTKYFYSIIKLKIEKVIIMKKISKIHEDKQIYLMQKITLIRKEQMNR